MTKYKKEELEDVYKIREEIITKPILPLLIRSSIPSLIGMLVNIIYNMTDIFWVGKLGDKSMIAAIGIGFSVVSLMQAIGFWFGYGSGNMMSRMIGEKNIKEAEIISADGVFLAIVSGILLIIPAMIFIYPFAEFLGALASERLMDYTVEYLFVMFISMPFSIFSMTVYNQMRLCGYIKDGLIGVLIGMFSNIVLDPVFIFVFKMNVVGAGVATLIGQFLSSIILIVFSYKQGRISVKLRGVNFTNKRLYHILAGGAPNFSRQGIMGIAAVLLNQFSAFYGEEVIAAFSVASKIISFGYMLMIGFGQGFQPICATNYGAKKYERVKEAFTITIVIGTAFLIIASIVMAVFAANFAMMFSYDSEVINYIVLILRFQCIVLPFMCFYAVSSMYMQNIGQYMKSFVISVSRQGIFYIPLLFMLSKYWKLKGLFVVQPISDILSFILSIFIIRKYLPKSISIRCKSS